MPLEPSELFPELGNLFEFPSVHSDMIYDTNRVAAYQQAIARTVRPGDVVADVGTGTGLLAFLCLQAGAARVHAIERSSIIECARKLALVNGWTDRIVFYHSDSRQTYIAERVDVIVSELIGHIAFEEGMVNALRDAKERFLKTCGTVIPQTVTLYATPVASREVYDLCIDCWKPIYGIDYSVMREQALATSYVVDIVEQELVTDYQSVFSVDLLGEGMPSDYSERRFRVHRSGEVTGVALWFEAMLADKVRLSSDPWSKTHWKQCFAPISNPISVSVGDELKVSLTMKLSQHAGDTFMFKANVIKEHRNAS